MIKEREKQTWEVDTEQNRKEVAMTDQRLVSMADWLDGRGTRKDPPKKIRKIKHQTTAKRLSENPRITTTTKKQPKTPAEGGRNAGGSASRSWFYLEGQ